jgi:hypothetical protein
MRDLLLQLVAIGERLCFELAGLREEIAASRRRQTTRERTVQRNRKATVTALEPSELDVERARRMLRRSP